LTIFYLFANILRCISINPEQRRLSLKKHVVRLSDDERAMLLKLISSGKGQARTLLRARILLKADEGDHGPAWADAEIADALEATVQTIERVRKQLVLEGLEATLKRRPYKTQKRRGKLDGEAEAHLVALACSDPPAGWQRWTLRLLADQMVELKYLDSISHEAVRQTLKKTKLSLGGR
jgi:transposase